MQPDSRFDHLRNLAAGGSTDLDETVLPPEAFEAFRRDGAAFGKFVLLGELGRGGTSVVYRAWQPDLRREVALKVVTGLNPELRERFLREARVGARLSHRSVLPVFEAGEADGSLWLAMPHVRGKTLDAREFGPREAALAVSAAARGVQAAHEAGVLHRDLKPRNIMMDDAGLVIVMDFGLALTREESTRISVTGQILGTPDYMAPEQAAGRMADERTDVYGLGATLYRLVAGRAPYECPTLQEFLRTIATRDPDPPSSSAAVPPDLETIVLKAIDREPVRRYPSATALADDLDRFARGEPVLGRRAPAAVRAWRWGKRRRSWMALAAMALVVALAVTRDGPARQGEPARAEQNAPVMATAPPVPPPPDPSRRLIQRARDLQHDGHIPEAIAAFEDLQREFPEIGFAWAGCAECKKSLHQWKSAEEDFTRAIGVDPEEAMTWLNRGECRLYLNDVEGAEKDYERVIAIDPGFAHGYLGRARVHALRLEWDLAMQDGDLAVAKASDNIWVRMERATLRYQNGRYADAIADYDEAIRIAGPRADLLRARGRAKLENNDAAGALVDLDRAVGLNPTLLAECADELVEARLRVSGVPAR